MMTKRLTALAILALLLALRLPAGAVGESEYIILPVSAHDEAIDGFAVSASGGGRTIAADAAKTETDGWQYTYYLPFENPPQEDTDFTITVTSKPKGLFAGLRKGASKTVTMTYNAIKSLTLQGPHGALGSGPLYLWSDSAPGQKNFALAAQKNPGAGTTGSTGHPYMTVKNYTAPVSWASSNEAVCTVDDSGLITAVGQGTATVTASVYGGKVAAAATVAVDACPPDDSGNPIAPDKLGQTVSWAGRSWWMVDTDGAAYGGEPGSVVLLANFNAASSMFGGDNAYSTSAVRASCQEFAASLGPSWQQKLSAHKYVEDLAWLPSFYEIYGYLAGVPDSYPETRQFCHFADSGVTASTPSFYTPVAVAYANAGSRAWLRSPDSSLPVAPVYACTVLLPSGGVTSMGPVGTSYSVRPVIILNP